ncbi:hypothetical protein [Streptomyces chrestomyceticus]|uniref:hypothetical protein n=1 Tax=Streptomyces chrestomyceticus TaxID=68185 RepID=UPI0033FEBF6E
MAAVAATRSAWPGSHGSANGCRRCTGAGRPAAGLLITGNVMVHAEALTGSAGVALDGAAPLEPFTE